MNLTFHRMWKLWAGTHVALAGTYPTLYRYNKQFLGKQYGNRNEGGTFMLGNSAVSFDGEGGIAIKGKIFKRTMVLREPLTRKRWILRWSQVRSEYIRTFWKLLLPIWKDTNPEATPTLFMVPSLEKYFSICFLRPCDPAYLRRYSGKSGSATDKQSCLYIDPEHPTAFSTLKRLQTAARQSKIGNAPGECKAWLEKQDVHSSHHPLRKKVPRKPCSVNNLMEIGNAI